MSATMEPWRAPPRTPEGPRKTSRTSAGNPTIAKVTSEAAATALEESAHFAPFSKRGRAFSFVRENTVTRYPFARRWPHIDSPITPVPIHPTVVASGDIFFIFTGSLVGRLPFLGGGETDRQVGDIGARWPGDDQVSQRLEERVGVVVLQMCAGVEPKGRGARDGGSVGVRTRGVGGSVDPVRSRGQDGHRSLAGQFHRRGEGELLVPPPLAAAAHAHRRLPAGDHHDGVSRGTRLCRLP